MLEQSVAAAAAEVAEARREIEASRRRAQGELNDARAALSVLPSHLAESTAAKLGISEATYAILSAVLASLAGNGLAALLFAIAGHAPPRPSQFDRGDGPIERSAVATIIVEKPQGRVDQFAVATIHPRAGGRVTLGDAFRRYRQWCEHEGYCPLPAGDFADELGALARRCGIQAELGTVPALLDVTLQLPLISLTAA